MESAIYDEISQWRNVLRSLIFFSIMHIIFRTFIKAYQLRVRTSKIQEDADMINRKLTIITNHFLPDTISNRLVSIIHATMAVLMGAYLLVFELRPCGAALGPYQRLGIELSVGYFLYDTIYEFCKMEAIDMIFHHICATIGLICGLYTNRSGTELMGSIFAAEVSTPFLHLRFLFRPLRSLSVKDERIYKILSLCFALTFLGFRVLTIGPVVTYCTVASPSSPFLVKLGGVTLYLLSLWWGVTMTKILYSHMRKRC